MISNWIKICNASFRMRLCYYLDSKIRELLGNSN